jgi:hypothetical protein
MQPNRACRILLTMLFWCAPWCMAQEDTRYDGALIGGIGGLGGNSRKTPLDVTGGTWAVGTHTSVYSIGYRQQLKEKFYGSVTYLNQGHYDRHGYRTRHHSRDDVQVELSIAKRLGESRWEINAGGGAAYYSETDQTGEGDDDFENHHGFGFVASGGVAFDLTSRLFLESRVHRHVVPGRYDSTTALVLLGVRLQSREVELPAGNKSKHSIRVNFGLGRLNSKQSETLKHAFQLAHELALSRRFSLATSYLREGKAPELDRKGVAIQGMAKQQLIGPLTLGLGLGPYINVDQSDFFERRNRVSVDALFTAFLDVRITKQLEFGVSTSRPRSLTTLRNKPMTDVFQTGLRFKL